MAENGASITVEVRLSAASGRSVTANLAVGPASTAVATDYTLGATAVTFAPSETTKSITLSPENDFAAEANETVVLVSMGPPRWVQVSAAHA